MARRLGPAGTVQHAPGHEYGQNRPRGVFTNCNGGNAINYQVTGPHSPKREGSGSWVLRAFNGDSFFRKATSYTWSKLHARMQSYQQLHHQEVAYKIQMRRNRCASIWLREIDFIRSNAISAQNSNYATHWQWWCSKVRNWPGATQICVFRCIFIGVLTFSLQMYNPSIGSTMQSIIQICWVMKEHPLVCTESALWNCS